MALSPAASPTDLLRIGGTGGDLATMHLLAKAFAETTPDVEPQVLPSVGSTGGIQALLSDALDVSISARALRAHERESALQAYPYAKTLLVFATPQQNPVLGVTTEELEQAYAGSTTLWPDGRPVRIVLRPEGDTDTMIVLAKLPSLKIPMSQARSRREVPVAVTDQEAADMIERLHWGLGTSSLSLLRAENRALKPLALNGVSPTLENLERGLYPLDKTYFFVVKAQSGKLARAFINFVATPMGRDILTRTGHLPLAGAGG
jgi:phosphate transport system substrate-binding protein